MKGIISNLQSEVAKGCSALSESGLVYGSLGNLSVIDRVRGLIGIKAAGVSCSNLKPEQVTVVDLNGETVYGQLDPSSDIDTHICLYEEIPRIDCIAHTHSTYAVAWAQANLDIPCLGTTQAHFCQGVITCTRPLSRKEIETDYKRNVASSIVESIQSKEQPIVKCALVSGHGAFAWGGNWQDVVMTCGILEQISKISFLTLHINPNTTPIDEFLILKHPII